LRITQRMRDLATSAVLGVTVALFVSAAHAAPVGTAFTYQGSLRDGSVPAEGSFDLEFTLYDDAAGGSPVVPAVVVEDVAVELGLFTVPLDFGAGAFRGDARWLAVGVRPGASTGAFTPIAGRQELKPAPNALAAPWDGVHGKPAGFADDVDDDALAALACGSGQIPEHDGSSWTCAADDDALAVLACATGQVAKRSGTGWICAADNDGLGALACANGQIPKLSGTTWTCAADANSGGDVTGVTAGTGLTGGGASGAVTLSADFAGSGSATTVSRTDHDHLGQTWSGVASTGLRVQNTSQAASTVGVRGDSTAASGSTYGVYGSNSSPQGVGVYGLNTHTGQFGVGIRGISGAENGSGVQGQSTRTTGEVTGVSGFINSDEGQAVQGFSNSLTGNGTGVAGSANGDTSVGVYGGVGRGTYGTFGWAAAETATGVGGWNQAFTGETRGVSGLVYSDAGAALFGQATSTTGVTNGVYGTVSSTSGRALEGQATASSGLNYGLFARTNSSAGYAGYFQGRVHVQGTLSKSAGSFKIDHPLDPENRTLSHSFVESPDMKNVYDGVVNTDAAGYATVELPEWFGALNRDFRYQLTVIDGGEAFVLAKVAREIEANRFVVRTSAGNVKVSWQVTGIRQDAYAEKHRIPVEEWKAEDQRGRYLNPDAFDAPEEGGVAHVAGRSPRPTVTPVPSPERLRAVLPQ
jgi:hypothetical protein